MWAELLLHLLCVSLQVLRGLAYLREKHQIMHRGNGAATCPAFKRS